MSESKRGKNKVVTDQQLNHKRQHQRYKMASYETKRQFVEDFMFNHTDEIRGLNATQSVLVLVKLFEQKTGKLIGKSWVAKLFRYEVGRKLYSDGKVQFYTNGEIEYEDLYRPKTSRISIVKTVEETQEDLEIEELNDEH